jgi:histidinol-phosphatase
MSDFGRELAFALELALLGGTIATKRLGRTPEVWAKADGTVVTEADRAIETEIRKRIAEEFPEHNVLGEEGGLRAAKGGPPLPDTPTWIVDPIDGTSNYVAGSPVWATLVAFRVDGENAVGAVHAPALDETYSAARGGGARLNGRPISVASPSGPSDAVIHVCGENDLVGDFRGHMLVACGAAHAMVEPCQLAAWDVAALEPIVAEAGGRLTALDGNRWAPGRPCLSSGEPLHSMLVDLGSTGAGSEATRLRTLRRSLPGSSPATA